MRVSVGSSLTRLARERPEDGGRTVKGLMHVIVRRTTRGPAAGCSQRCCLLAVACSGDSGGPTGPTPPSPGATSSVSVTYPADHGTIYIGDQLQFEATVSSSGGGTQAATSAGLGVGCAWCCDGVAVRPP